MYLDPQNIPKTQNTKPQAPKWIVYNGKPIKMDDLGGKPLFLETPIWMSRERFHSIFIQSNSCGGLGRDSQRHLNEICGVIRRADILP